MPRAATEEKFRNGSVRSSIATTPTGCPADDFQQVVVTATDDVTARISQPPHDIEVTGRGRPVHRIGVVALLPCVHVQAAFQQQVHCRHVPGESSCVQQCVLV